MYLSRSAKIDRIGFVSTRFQGTDGVSLETSKWAAVLEKMGYECFYFAGQSDWDSSHTMVVPEAFFGHENVVDIQERCFGTTIRSGSLTGDIQALRFRLKTALHDFISKYRINLLVIENALTIPMHIPFGLAITELIAETGIPAVAHHHDFVWERQRFLVNAVEDYLSMAFPPRLHSINHVVINTEGRRQLSYRCGLAAVVIPNVHDFDSPPPEIDDYTRGFRSALGLNNGELLLLQPTRVIARKGIEHAVELANRLRHRKAKLLISHQERDEGSAYYKRTMDYAKLLDVDVLIRPDLISAERGVSNQGIKTYSLNDCYLNADFVTYPSSYEGFGNAFLEAVWFKKPLMVNRYSIFQQDIEPIGFDVVVMDNYVTPEIVELVETILDSKETREIMAMKNYALAKKYFSYELLERRLSQVLMSFGKV